jgi:hypothetical protein
MKCYCCKRLTEPFCPDCYYQISLINWIKDKCEILKLWISILTIKGRK